MISWLIGSTVNITWTSLDVPTEVKIEISFNGGSSWSTIDADAPNTGSYSYVVPNNPTTNARYKISGLAGWTDTDGATIDFNDITVTSDDISVGNSINVKDSKITIGIGLGL